MVLTFSKQKWHSFIHLRQGWPQTSQAAQNDLELVLLSAGIIDVMTTSGFTQCWGLNWGLGASGLGEHSTKELTYTPLPRVAFLLIGFCHISCVHDPGWRRPRAGRAAGQH